MQKYKYNSVTRFLRKMRAQYIQRKYGDPSRDMTVIGVTGTDGKSTTAELIYQQLSASHIKTGLISTIGGKIGEKVFDTGLHTSTPSSEAVYRAFSEMKKEGITTVVLEQTSHGLDQQRTSGIRLKLAVFTNITHEHLDYHGTFEAYRRAKCRIIDMVVENGYVVINRDDPSWEYITAYAANSKKNLHIVYYTRMQTDLHIADKAIKLYKAEHIEANENGQKFDIHLSNVKFSLELQLPGLYNVSNALAAVSAAVSIEVPLAGIVKGIQQAKNIPGRFIVLQKTPFTVIVDFAHTPNAIREILSLLSTRLNTGRLIVVFGSAGERDASKRLLMGKEVSNLADVIIITAEDPRREKFTDIAEMIVQGIDKTKFVEKSNLFVIESREEAIKTAITGIAKEGDIVIMLGKGHEQSMCIGTTEYPWDEVTVVKKYIYQK